MLRATAFALFVKSQRKWTAPPTKPESIVSFQSRLKEFGYSTDYILPHGSYLVNMGNPDVWVYVLSKQILWLKYPASERNDKNRMSVSSMSWSGVKNWAWNYIISSKLVCIFALLARWAILSVVQDLLSVKPQLKNH